MGSKKEIVRSMNYHQGKLVVYLGDKDGITITRGVDSEGWPQGAVHLLLRVLEGRLADLEREINDALSRTPKPRLKNHRPS